MKLGVVSTAVRHLEVHRAVEHLAGLGVDCVELGCAGYVASELHGDARRLVRDGAARAEWIERLGDHGIEISALAVHGQSLTPDPREAREYSEQFRASCELAAALNVTRLTLLAGLPEASPGDTAPSWITSPHPPGSADRLRWQWEERVIPYWSEHGAFAEQFGCRLCFEMHPGDVVFNPASLRRLRDAVGPVIACNFDPSHLFWQGIDVLEALRHLGELIVHVHAKDTAVLEHNVRLNGVLDPKPLTELRDRAWSFRTVGYGHGALFWREFVSTLRLIGYDDVVSIEHEDEYLQIEDGLAKAVRLLSDVLDESSRTRSVATTS